MIPVVSRAQIRAFDARAIDVVGLPGAVLMENAGRGAAEAILDMIAAPAAERRVVIVCGTGNNGGDGFVVARHLWLAGVRPSVFLCGAVEACSPDARVHCDAYVGIGGAVHLVSEARDVARLREEVSRAGLLVDALFGTGLDRPIAGVAAEVVAALNAAGGRNVSLDIPSGLDADTGVPHGPTVRADATLTFALPKLGLLTPRGAAYAGHVTIVSIGVPGVIAADLAQSAELLERSDVIRWLTPRRADTHKYAAGHVAILAGSPGHTGAALLAARGAMRAGAGATTIVTWPEVAAGLEARVTEVMVTSIHRERIGESLNGALVRKSAAVVGPGFGLDDAAHAALDYVLGRYLGPLVLDADAITLLSRSPELLTKGPARILTPHAGELARLLGTSADAIESDRFRMVRLAAEKTRAVVVLKGAHTLIADPEGRIVVAPRGAPALATAGAGDVLSGTIAALACSLGAFEAACVGAYLHAVAGERWAASHADRGLLASEIAETLPEVPGELVPRAASELTSRIS